MENQNLDFVTTEELIEELRKRYAALIIAAEDNKIEKETETTFHYSGGLSRAIGLGTRLLRRLQMIAAESERDDEDIDMV